MCFNSPEKYVYIYRNIPEVVWTWIWSTGFFLFFLVAWFDFPEQRNQPMFSLHSDTSLQSRSWTQRVKRNQHTIQRERTDAFYIFCLYDVCLSFAIFFFSLTPVFSLPNPSIRKMSYFCQHFSFQNFHGFLSLWAKKFTWKISIMLWKNKKGYI